MQSLMKYGMNLRMMKIYGWELSLELAIELFLQEIFEINQNGGKMDINIASTGFAGLTSRFDLKKPVIAAVNGVSMGGGFEIALACDLIVASTNAKFALPEPKVGLAALAGGMQGFQDK